MSDRKLHLTPPPPHTDTLHKKVRTHENLTFLRGSRKHEIRNLALSCVAVGSSVGSAVGFGVGSAVGFWVGSAVGFGVGSAVGFGVSSAVGFGVGAAGPGSAGTWVLGPESGFLVPKSEG